MPYALILDVDGVIANTEPISARAATEVFRDRYGVDVPVEMHFEYVGATPPKHMRGLAEAFDLDIDIEDAIAAHQRTFLEHLVATKDSLSFPGVKELVERVSELPEWHIALATGSGRTRSRATIQRSGLGHLDFAAWVTGDDVHHPKPDPETYIKVASELGLFPRQCVVIEDSLAGVTAAKAASMYCIAVTNTFPGERLRSADRIVDSFEDIDITGLYDIVVEG